MKTSILLISLLFSIPGALLLISLDSDITLASIKREARRHARANRDRSNVRQRLAELGKTSDRDYEDFRLKQVGYCAASALLAFALSQLARTQLLTSLIFSGLIAALVLTLIDRELTSQIKKRRERIEGEFPAIIEMMVLAIAAGETPLAAMARITESAQGVLVDEFGVVIAEIKSGQSLQVALDALGRRVHSIVIRRFVDALVTATLRGAPLVEVLSEHAREARAVQRNRVLSSAGKAEISMMIPVVFLILPISILFALWPSLANLNLFAS